MKQPSDIRPDIDRRRERRFSNIVTVIRHHSLIAVPRNLSAHGLALETTSGLRIGNRYRLELQTTTTVTRVEATVRWCRLHAIRRSPDGSDFEPLFLAGLKLDTPAQLGKALLRVSDVPPPGTQAASVRQWPVSMP